MYLLVNILECLRYMESGDLSEISSLPHHLAAFKT